MIKNVFGKGPHNPEGPVIRGNTQKTTRTASSQTSDQRQSESQEKGNKRQTPSQTGSGQNKESCSSGTPGQQASDQSSPEEVS